MNFRSFTCTTLFLATALLLGAASVCAQQQPDDPSQQQQNPPQQTEPAPIDEQQAKPAARSFPTPLILYGTGGEEQDTNPYSGYTPDYGPLTGIQNATLGIPDPEHSYWVPGIQYGLNAISPPNNTPGADWNIENFIIGNVTVLDTWSRSQLAFNYSGGGFFSTDQSQVPNGQYQSLSINESYRANRWIFQVLDQFSYLPQSSFGFGGGTNLGIAGIGGTLGSGIGSLGNSFVPSQSIYGQGPQISNSGGLQFTYMLSHRGSITASAVYGLLHFIQGGFVDSNTLSAGLGYNYQLSPKDTIGVVYHFNNYQFPGNSQAYDDHTVSLAYGRKITGRLALRLSGGPEITLYRIAEGGASRTIGESISASLTYAFERGSVAVTYGHGLSGGSGVYIGSELDQLTFSPTRRLTRMWTGSASVGYANNRPLVSNVPNSGFNYTSVYVGGSLSRPLGRDMNLSMAYTASFNSTGSGTCTGVACNAAYNGQTFTLNFQWHARPFLIRSF